MLDRTTAVEPSPESPAVFWLTKFFYEGVKKIGPFGGDENFFANVAMTYGCFV
jgi:hypothetical protein